MYKTAKPLYTVYRTRETADSSVGTEGQQGKLWGDARESKWRGVGADDHTVLPADQQLVNTVLESPCHVLEQMLPPALPLSYHFRKRAHIRQIPNRCCYLTDCNFLNWRFWFCCILSFYTAMCLY